MSMVDREIMRVIDFLQMPQGRKLWEATMIIRTSDHGEMGLTHGGTRQKWFNVYEETLKVPLVWSNPVMFPEPLVSDALDSLVDLLPTLASFCCVQDPEKYAMQGNDYSPLFENPSGEIQDYTYFINTDVKAGQAVPAAAFPPNDIAMVRDANFKYANYYGGARSGAPQPEAQEEFYNLLTDIDHDTGETVELHNKSEWAEQEGATWEVTSDEKEKRAEMKALLAEAMTEGVLTPQSRVVPPVEMKPRVKVVTYAWEDSADIPAPATPQVYQVVFYSQHTYNYTLQVSTGDDGSDVASTTTFIPTTLSGNNGAQLFQPQPTLPSRPVYRVARTASDGQVDYEDVTWDEYQMA